MPLDTNRIQALLFDVDGTLRDTDDQYVRQLQGLLEPFTSLFPSKDLERFSRRVVMSLESPAHLLYTTLDWLGLDDEFVGLSNWLEDLRVLKPKSQFLVVPGIPESLAQLGERCPMAVVSARGARGTTAFLEEANLSAHFQAVASGQTVERTKPWPDPVFWAAEQLEVLPENCLMVGDTTVDIRAGRKAGAQTVGVLSGFGSESELRRAGADLILATAAQLTDILV